MRYEEKPAIAAVGERVKRRNIREVSIVVAVAKNVAILNEVDYIHTVSLPEFQKHYVGA